jgi:hypothetical protein
MPEKAKPVEGDKLVAIGYRVQPRVASMLDALVPEGAYGNSRNAIAAAAMMRGLGLMLEESRSRNAAFDDLQDRQARPRKR